MLGRRNFLGGVGAAAAGVATSKVAAPIDGTQAAPAAVQPAPAPPAPVPLSTAGVTPGARFGTCTVFEVGPGEGGAVRVAFDGADGRRFELEILGHDARTPGVARAGSLAVY